MYYGDINLGETIDIKFTTVNASGLPTQLAGTPVVSAYPGNSTTELTAGITLSVDFDSRTGLNNVRVVATSGNGYAAATNYTLVITTGTVDGNSVVGYTFGSFSIENRSALRPATAGRTLNVAADGDIGGNVDGSVASVVGAVGSVTGSVGSVTGNVGGNVAGSVGSVTGAVGGNVTGSVGSLATQAKADVNAEVLDVLNVDTFAQPGQEAPAATTTLANMIRYLFKAFRNRSVVDKTDGEHRIYADDDTTVDQKATISDDGDDFVRGKWGSGA